MITDIRPKLSAIVAASGAAALMLGLAFSARAQTVGPSLLISGQCIANKTAYKTTTAGATTNLTNFTNIPDTDITFTQGGTNPGCAIVHFSGKSVSVGGRLTIRAMLDGKTVAQPGSVYLQDGDGFLAAARSFIFVFPKVVPGKHTLKMQMRLQSSSQSIQINTPTTTIMYQ